jgi:2',3'-cyclic-nucleotide 2'-phosphodiesterase (5'-nucleotidase family)
MNGRAWRLGGCRLRWALVALASGSTLAPAAGADDAPSGRVVLSIVGTNDLHGHMEALPWLAGYLANLRSRRQADGGAVVLLDAGDLLPGTIEAQLDEGALIVQAYNRLGYAAAAIGNHDFDFGPVGSAGAVGAADPRGALRARAREAKFPLLAANLQENGRPLGWSNVRPSALIQAAGVKVGLVGVTTAAAAHLISAANFRGLSVSPLEAAIEREARTLRAQGAEVVVVLAHEGGDCARFDSPDDVRGCRPDGAIFGVARALSPGLVDLIVAGHTHQGVAHRIGGIPIIESFSEGRAFGRVDLVIDRRTRQVQAHILPPTSTCGPSEQHAEDPFSRCRPEDYEGRPVIADRAISDLIAPALARAQSRRAEKLGTQVDRPLWRSRDRESPLGNAIADLFRQAQPRADLAVVNAGGVRADLPAGPLTYGELYAALPFDNTFAVLRRSAAEVSRALATYYAHSGTALSFSGARVAVRCAGPRVMVDLSGPDGRPIGADQLMTVVTSDYLATGRDSLFARRPEDEITEVEIRDALADLLRNRRRPLSPGESFSRTRPRLTADGELPLRCRPGPR